MILLPRVEQVDAWRRGVQQLVHRHSSFLSLLLSDHIIKHYSYRVLFFTVHPGVSKSRYFGISIPIKYSNFSRFYKKMGPFYKKFRCDKFGN